MNTKSFLLGAIVGFVPAALAVYVVAAPQVHAAEEHARTAAAELDRRTQAFNESAAAIAKLDSQNCQRMLATQSVIDATQPPTGFTALTEPAPAQPSPLQLFDVVRPGLGTMLAKLQTQRSQAISVRWVIPGHVMPATNSEHYSYCWLDATGNADPHNCPASIATQ